MHDVQHVAGQVCAQRARGDCVDGAFGDQRQEEAAVKAVATLEPDDEAQVDQDQDAVEQGIGAPSLAAQAGEHPRKAEADDVDAVAGLGDQDRSQTVEAEQRQGQRRGGHWRAGGLDVGLEFAGARSLA